MELKKCPFCNGDAFFSRVGNSRTSSDLEFGYTIKCKKCGVSLPETFNTRITMDEDGKIYPISGKDHRNDAIAKWNKREKDDELESVK